MNTKQKLLLKDYLIDIWKKLYQITLETPTLADIHTKQCDFLKSELDNLEALIEAILRCGDKE